MVPKVRTGIKIMRMEIFFTPELEAILNRIAAETGRSAVEVVTGLVAAQLDYDTWFRQQVGQGIVSLDRGDSVSHEEVSQRIEQMLHI